MGRRVTRAQFLQMPRSSSRSSCCRSLRIMEPLTNAEIRTFKAQAQRLKATLKIGKEGISPKFLAALDDALKYHELVKVKFDDFKDQKKELSPQLAEKTSTYLITRVATVVVLYRPNHPTKK